MNKIRLQAAIAAGNAAAYASRVLGKGAGISIRGQVIEKIAPRALESLLAGRRVFAVTGTNGKTTTTHMLAAALSRQFPGDVVTNADGANLGYGLVSTLSANRTASVAALETDERVVTTVCQVGKPDALIILNLSRDQLDRNHEISFLARDWRNTLATAGEGGPLVVATVDDPLVVWAAQGAHRVVWVDAGGAWTQDATLCPECGAVLTRDDQHWSCPDCGLHQPDANYTVNDATITCPDGQTFTPRLQVPGAFNVGNAACALAVAVDAGVPAADAIAACESITAPAGRFSTVTIGTTQARLLLAKNPAGWAVTLPLLDTETVVLALDSQFADGQDVSWLWDVEYEQLAEKFSADSGRTVIATGYRACDLAVRLQHAEVPCELIVDLEAALRRAGELSPQTPVDVLATYTPFQILRKLGGQR